MENKKVIDTMGRNENLDWCKPYYHQLTNSYAVICNGDIINIIDNGKEIFAPNADEIKIFAQKLANCDDAKYAIIDNMEEIGCVNCPWASVCEAMQEDVED